MFSHATIMTGHLDDKTSSSSVGQRPKNLGHNDLKLLKENRKQQFVPKPATIALIIFIYLMTLFWVTFILITVCSERPYLVQSLLPAVLSFDHQLDAVRQGRENSCCGGLEGDGLTLKVYPVHTFWTGRGKHWHRQKQRSDWVWHLPHDLIKNGHFSFSHLNLNQLLQGKAIFKLKYFFFHI